MTSLQEVIEKLQSDALMEVFGVAEPYDSSNAKVDAEDIKFCFGDFPAPTRFENLDIYYSLLMPHVAPIYGQLDETKNLKARTHWATLFRPSVNAEVIKSGDDYAVIMNFGVFQAALSFDRMYRAHFDSIMTNQTTRNEIYRFANGQSPFDLSIIRCTDAICNEAGALIWALLAREANQFSMWKEVKLHWPTGENVTVFTDAIVSFYCAHELCHISRGHFDGEFWADQTKSQNDFVGMRIFSRGLATNQLLPLEYDADRVAASMLLRSSKELGHNPVDAALSVSAWFMFLGLVERARMVLEGGEEGERIFYERLKQRIAGHEQSFGIAVDKGIIAFAVFGEESDSHPQAFDRASCIASATFTLDPIQKLKANMLYRMHQVLVESLWHAVRGAFLHAHNVKDQLRNFL